MKFCDAIRIVTEEGAPPSRDVNKKVIRDNKGKVVRGGTGLVVFDIDDNLLTVDSSKIKVYKKVNNGPEVGLTTGEFANDDGKDEHGKPKPGVKYDYRDFRDPAKLEQSFKSPKTKWNMPVLKALDNYIREGYDFCFLTARGMEDSLKKTMDELLRYMDKFGKLQPLGKVFKKELSFAINDSKYDEKFKGMSDPEKKSAVLKELCNKYDNVVFFDDDKNNVKSARNLGIPNLRVVHTKKS